MKHFTLFLFLFSLGSFSFAHDFYFAYAEIEINELNQRIEATVYATTHDLERELREETGNEIKIYGQENNSTLLSILEQKINDGFQISSHNQKFRLKIDGLEVKLNGTTFFYLSAEIEKVPEEMNVTFDLLMKTFPDQQNKLDLRMRGRTSTYFFIHQNKTAVIQLNKKDE